MRSARPLRFLGAAVVLSALLAAPVPGDDAAPVLSDETFDELLLEVLPDDSECAFESEIPWRPAFAAALGEARERDRPVLLWAMNGQGLVALFHPDSARLEGA